ncbi:MAG: response regulator [Pirellulaceae bacterium]|nr:response regulator [Pirellulaceae bacterium]
MAARTCFNRSCPTCGRSLEIRVELLNRQVECSHCLATFVASHDQFGASLCQEESVSDLRIEQALARTQQFLADAGVNTTTSKVG